MTKPIAAVFIFMDEKESAYRKKNPKMDKKELSRLMLQDFNSLPAKEKVTDTSRHVTSHHTCISLSSQCVQNIWQQCTI